MCLKVAKHWEPDLSSEGVSLLQGSVISKRMIVEEHTGCNVEGNEHIDGVMLMSRQNEENAKHVQHPGENVQVVHSSGSICK